MKLKTYSNAGLIELLHLVVGNREDILLARGDRTGCMRDNDKYANMYQAARSEYDEVVFEIVRRMNRIHQDIAD